MNGYKEDKKKPGVYYPDKEIPLSFLNFSDKEIDRYFELTNSPIIVHALRISNGFNHHKKEEPKKEQKEAGKEEKVEEAQG